VIYYTDLGQKVVQPGMEVLFPVLHLQFLWFSPIPILKCVF
jgi:hypothetical protein